jgi:hypothetical protein
MRGSFPSANSARLFVTLLSAAFVCACLLSATASFAQDKPDRPPWAQKPRAAGGEKTQPQPAEPADSQDDASQRGRIRVSVNLVNVLVSVLDEHNRPRSEEHTSELQSLS